MDSNYFEELEKTLNKRQKEMLDKARDSLYRYNMIVGLTAIGIVALVWTIIRCGGF